MDRQALILYLETVRDLEAMKYRINKLWTSKKVTYEVYAQHRFTEATRPAESSPRNVEEYSRLAVNYNRAQALISMAYYLMDR